MTSPVIAPTTIALEIKLHHIFNAIKSGNFKEASARLVPVFEQAQNEGSTATTMHADIEEITLATLRHITQKDPDAGLNLFTQILQKYQEFPNKQSRAIFEDILLSDVASTEAKINGFIIGSGLIDCAKQLQAVKMIADILETIPLSKRAVVLAKKLLSDTRSHWNTDTPQHSEFSPHMITALEKIKAGMQHLSPVDAYEQIDNLFYEHPDLTAIRVATFKRLEDSPIPRISAADFIQKLG